MTWHGSDQVRADARRQAEQEARQQEYKEQLRREAEQQKAEREARRPACAGCGTKFTDGRWEAAENCPKQVGRWHPTLCGECEERVVEAEQQAEREDQAVPKQKDGGWLSRFRT
ncbi:hypothetical protein [Streptomyces sp. NPDC048665]|uniref:hypothetical protein n=1 Tax=unclassified Streptomyces TaxID=2593676 RepID=UPI00343060D2